MLREVWAIAIESLRWMEMRGLSESLAFSKAVQHLAIDNPEALRLARVMVFESVKRKNLIDAFLTKVVGPSEIEKLDLNTKAFLRLYVNSVQFSQNRSEINLEKAETAAKTSRAILGWKRLLPVEPYLGTLLIQKPQNVLQIGDDEAREELLTFHPKWFVKYCYRLFGRIEAIDFLKADSSLLPTYFRLNTLKAEEDMILSRLAKDGIEVEKINGLQFEYRLVMMKGPLAKTESFREGLIRLQDKSVAFAAEAANLTLNSTVIDACSAPGTVTTYLAQLMKNTGNIVCLDYSKRRTKLWKNEIFRSDVEVAESIITDASRPLPLSSEAEVVFVNPPSTDTGLFARLPSAKWRLTPHSIERMAELQFKILQNCCELTMRGGSLVYFTSSITEEENEMVIEKFLKWHPEFFLTKITPDLGVPGLRGLVRCRRLYPHTDGCNGAFVAKLIRT